jgi:hypothetical protein
MRNPFRYGVIAVLVPLLTGLGGCGAGGDDPAPAASASAAMSDEQLLAIGREYARCARESGLTVDEPSVEDGRLRVPLVVPEGQEASPPAVPADCESILRRLPEGVLGRAPVSAEDVERIERFSQCVRENGIPQWPDPNPDGSLPLTDPSIVKSDVFQNARRACQHHYDGELREARP